MHDQRQNPLLWPTWRWQGSGWWFTIAGAAAGAIAFLWPTLASRPASVRLAWVVAAFTIAPILLLILAFGGRSLAVALRRMSQFSAISRQLGMVERELSETKEMVKILVRERGDAPRFELRRVLRYGDYIFISVPISQYALRIGDRLSVVDDSDGVVFGYFEVTEIRSDEYRARNVGAVNAVWAGFLHQFNQAETPAPPGTIALLVAKGSAHE